MSRERGMHVCKVIICIQIQSVSTIHTYIYISILFSQLITRLTKHTYILSLYSSGWSHALTTKPSVFELSRWPPIPSFFHKQDKLIYYIFGKNKLMLIKFLHTDNCCPFGIPKRIIHLMYNRPTSLFCFNSLKYQFRCINYFSYSPQ